MLLLDQTGLVQEIDQTGLAFWSLLHSWQFVVQHQLVLLPGPKLTLISRLELSNLNGVKAF